MKLVALVQEPKAVARFLRHLGEPAEPSSARALSNASDATGGPLPVTDRDAVRSGFESGYAHGSAAGSLADARSPHIVQFGAFVRVVATWAGARDPFRHGINVANRTIRTLPTPKYGPAAL